MAFLSRLMSRFGRFIFETNDAIRMSRLQYDTSDLTIFEVPYIADDTRAHRLEIIRHKDAPAGLPVIVNIHGGGLFASYKEVNTPFNCEWARKGYDVVSISYRRLPDTTLIHQIEDVMAALRFIRTNSTHYRLNLKCCYLTGDSAGALLALFALAIESEHALQQSFGITPSGITFRAAALISIMLDTSRKDLLSFLRHVISSAEDVDKPYLPYLFNPSLLISETHLPPIYLVTGVEDIIQQDTLKADRLLTEVSAIHQLSDWSKGTRHRLTHVFSVLYPLWYESRQVFTDIDSFFRSQS